MNGKQARKLRKIVREDMPNFPERQYRHVNVHTKQYATGTINLDGTPRYIPLELSTVELVACQRVAYQKAKQLHHMYNFTQ